MMRVTTEEAKERLDALLAEAARGGEVVIEAGDGSGKGWFVVRDDFDEPLEDFKGG